MANNEDHYSEEKLLENNFPNLTKDSPLFQQKLTDIHEIEHSLQTLMTLCGQQENLPDLDKTPFRVVKAFLEYTTGYRENPEEHLAKTFDITQNDPIIVKDIEFYSMCEHHFAPFFGVAHVAYIPNQKVTGLSKIARVVEGYARRFQVQERLTNQIADAVVNMLDPKGVIVAIEAKHLCVSSRGVKKEDAKTFTIVSHGVYSSNPQLRSEFMMAIK
ncbi:GTP cyclohydrolase I FolE [Lapidilactobacillus bayanensis]|uniref:GTP cyclohydrolase I FolE n=1 Tax=Lapidilactobacillus bayanensis TaxID=2485998 RepID=UPI000F783420|nr:GTP cyclohydrolase I FolE [Lapidilactobacillus bayanensis]